VNYDELPGLSPHEVALANGIAGHVARYDRALVRAVDGLRRRVGDELVDDAVTLGGIGAMLALATEAEGRHGRPLPTPVLVIPYRLLDHLTVAEYPVEELTGPTPWGPRCSVRPFDDPPATGVGLDRNALAMADLWCLRPAHHAGDCWAEPTIEAALMAALADAEPELYDAGEGILVELYERALAADL
jgi:hypothetical protein